MPPPLSSTLAGAAASLLFAIGVTVATLTAHAVDSTSGFVGKGTSNLRGDLRGQDLNLLPKNYDKTPNWVIQGAGVVAAITGLLGLLDVIFKLTEEATSEAFYATIMNGSLGSLSVILSVAALIYGMISHAQSSTWHYEGINTLNGKYTVEGWACQMKDLMVEHEDEFGMICKETKTARFLTIALVLCSIAFTIGAFLREKIRRANIRRRRDSKYITENELRSF